MTKQLDLFARKPAEPFRLTYSPDLIVCCKHCGRQILVQHTGKDPVVPINGNRYCRFCLSDEEIQGRKNEKTAVFSR